MPFDLATLERGVQKFLTQIEDLGQYLTDPQLAARAAPWLLALVGAGAAWHYSRRRKHQRHPGWPVPEGDWLGPGRTWLPGLAVSRHLEESDGSGTA